MDEEFRTITIKKATKDEFDKLGNLAMTQDEVLKSLITFWKKYKDVADRYE